MASQKLKDLLRDINPAYLDYADIIHRGEFTNKTELRTAHRKDLLALGIPKGTAGAIIAEARGEGDSFVALLSHHQPLVVCSALSEVDPKCDLCMCCG